MVDTVLIIAAGMGTRLADGSGIPKPLRKVGGLPLIKRILLLCAKAHMKKAYIVVGFEKQKIINYVQSQKWPLEIEFIHNDEWKKSNGLSVLAAKNIIQDNFILLMSDHIFDSITLEKLAQQNLGSDVLRLAVDYNLNDVFWMEDATKVVVESNKIASIDKNLTEFNAVDTGMFLMTPQIFTALEESKKGDDCSLSDGVRKLATAGKASVFNIGKAFWQDVDDARVLKHTETQLLQSCRKETDGFISRHFNRYISLTLSRLLMNTPISANMITCCVALVGILSGYFAMQGSYWNYLFAAVLFVMASIIDGVDGELSRLKFTSSQFGQWFDTVSDNITYFAFFLGTALGLYRTGQMSLFWPAASIIGLTFILFIMYIYIIVKTDSGSLLVVQQDLHGEAEQSLVKRIAAQIQTIMKRDFFAVAFLVFALLGKPQWVVYCVAVFTHVGWIYLLTFVLRKIGQVQTPSLAPSHRTTEQNIKS